MVPRQRGFSLMEALVAVLVLSVGLLGLGQLQARLWNSAGQLYALSDAYLLSTSHLERGPPGEAQQPGAGENQQVHSVSAYTAFDSIVQAEQRGRFTEMVVSSHWRDTAGEHRVQLRTAVYRPAASDSRWLLRLD